MILIECLYEKRDVHSASFSKLELLHLIELRVFGKEI